MEYSFRILFFCRHLVIKFACVQRCIRIIQNLIRLASNSAAGADDTIPILIYVIVKANPPNLLSIIQ